MTSTQHTGVVVSAKEADAWQAEIRRIMADRSINFGPAVDWYIAQRQDKRVPVKLAGGGTVFV